MKKPQTNYAFIDGPNLYRTMQEVGWDLDYHRFRIYLSEHYDVGKAYYFIGYMLEEYATLYLSAVYRLRDNFQADLKDT